MSASDEEVFAALKFALSPDELPPSDIVPGISPVAIDYKWALSEIERLQSKLDELQPCVIRVGGLFNLYQNAYVRVQTPDAQMMWDYLNTTFPRGQHVRWFILPPRGEAFTRPQQPPFNPS